MRHIFLTIFFFFLAGCVSAQSYGAATGLRLGNSNDGRTLGLTAQYRLSKHLTLEGILQTDFANDHLLHLLIEEHQPFLTKRINIYIGTGISMGQERSVLLTDEGRMQQIVDRETLGLDLVAGIEATLIGYTVSLDVKPNFNLIGREQWVENQVAVSIRHVVLSGAKQNKKRRQRERDKRKKEREKRRKDREPLFGDWFSDLFKKD